MGLSYLNKKSWHPGSFKNIEEVWKAEQKALEIERKHAETLKKLKEEKHIEELKKLQVQAGIIPAHHLERLEFLYDGGRQANQNIIESVKVNVNGSITEQYQLKDKKKPYERPPLTEFKEEISNPRNEAFLLLHEDPMFEVMKQEVMRNQQLQSQYLAQFEGRFNNQNQQARSRSRSKKKEKKEKKDKKDKIKDKKDKKYKKEKKEKKDKKEKKENNQKQDKSKEEQSQTLYEQYLIQSVGMENLIRDKNGRLKPDYNKYRHFFNNSKNNKTVNQKMELDNMKQNAMNYDKLRQEERKQAIEKIDKNLKQNYINQVQKDMLNQTSDLQESLYNKRHNLAKNQDELKY